MVSRFLLLALLLLTFAPRVSSQDDCSGVPLPRLRSGMIAETSSGQSNNVRDAADTDAKRTGQIPADSRFQVLSDASCADGYYWYQVDYQGLMGWTVEGADGEYWLLPVIVNNPVITPENIHQLQVIDEFLCPEGDTARPLVWSPDGTRLLWTCLQSAFYITDWVSGETTEIPLPEHYHLGRSTEFAAFYAAGTRFLNYRFPDIDLWDTGAGQLLEASLPDVHNLAINGNTLAVDGEFGIYLFDLLRLEEINSLQPDNFSVIYSLAFSPDASHLAMGGAYDEILIWTLATDAIFRVKVGGDHVQRVQFSPSGRYLLAAVCEVPNRGDCSEPVIKWIDASTGDISTRWQEDTWDNIWDIQFGEDLIFLNVDYHLEAIQISTSERRYLNDDHNFNRFLVSIDGRLVISSAVNRVLVYGIP